MIKKAVKPAKEQVEIHAVTDSCITADTTIIGRIVLSESFKRVIRSTIGVKIVLKVNRKLIFFNEIHYILKISQSIDSSLYLLFYSSDASIIL